MAEKKVNRVIWNRLAELIALKARKEARKITQDTIVEETGISKQTVNSYMNNDRQMYSTRVIAVLCEYLDIHPKEFFVWVEVSEGPDDAPEVRTPLPASA